MTVSKIGCALLWSIAGVSALSVPSLLTGTGIGAGNNQLPLGWKVPPSSSLADLDSLPFTCNLPPAIDPSGHDELPSADDLFSGDAALAKQVERHQAVVRVPSISYDDLGPPDEDERWEPFHHLHQTLASIYPNIHRRAKLEKVNTLGLVYTLEGTDPSLKPTLLAAHQDVVPVADASTWAHPPFAAVYDGEWLWGRGAGDDKNSLTALLSAVEALVSDGEFHWTPRRTLILAFGFDEECSGPLGAGAIGRFLTERYGDDGIAVILDEGGLNMIPVNASDDINENVVLYALPAVIEKGHVDIYLELRVAGGHSSIPPPHTAIGIAAEIVSAIESSPYEPLLLPDGPTHRHLQCLARYSPGESPDMTDAIRNGDLERAAGLLAGSSRSGRSMITTAQAVDVIRGGQKINALPEVVTLGVNYRVAPQDTIPGIQRDLVRHIASVVAKYGLDLSAYPGDQEYADYIQDDEPVTTLTGSGGSLVLNARDKSKGTPISPTSGPVWDTFAGTIRHTFAFEGGLVVPVGEIMTGNTDTRHYLNLSPHIYRWSPAVAGAVLNIHTVDERVRMQDHVGMVKFYYDFVRNFDQADF